MYSEYMSCIAGIASIYRVFGSSEYMSCIRLKVEYSGYSEYVSRIRVEIEYSEYSEYSK